MSVGIIITARIKSSRIPDKVLQYIGNKRAIEILLNNVVNDKYPVVLAIPENSDDDELEQIAKEKGVDVYRGYDDSPLHRLYNCAVENEFDHVVRITADDLLIDLQILFGQIKHHVNGGRDYTYCRRCLEGAGAEVISTEALRKVVQTVGEKPVEFISYFLKTGEFNTFEYFPPFAFQFNYRCVMDWPEDLMLLRVVFASLHEPFSSLDVIHFLKAHKYFLQINHLPEVTLYTCNYNTSAYILDTIKSVLALEFTDWEFIIYDDHSDDNSVNIITEFLTTLTDGVRRKIRVLRGAENIGLPAACNKILGMARGKYIMRIDSDDTVRPSIITKMLDEIKSQDTHCCLSGYTKTDEALQPIETINKNEWHPGCSLISVWCANELKYQDGLEFMEGAEFFNRFRKRYKASFVPEALWNYRNRPGQKTADPRHPCNK